MAWTLPRIRNVHTTWIHEVIIYIIQAKGREFVGSWELVESRKYFLSEMWSCIIHFVYFMSQFVTHSAGPNERLSVILSMN